MLLSSFVSSNAILHLPACKQDQNQDGNLADIPPLIFLLTGNPGLVGYYEEYLGLLAGLESVSQVGQASASKSDQSNRDTEDNLSRKQYIVAGFSLGGFDLDDESSSLPQHHEWDDNAAAPVAQHDDSGPAESNNNTTPGGHGMIQSLLFPPTYTRKDVYGLTDQIELSYIRLQYLCQQLREHYQRHQPRTSDTSDDGHGPCRPIKVILAGHSVGAYIALEMVRLHHEHEQIVSSSTPAASLLSSSSVKSNGKGGEKSAQLFSILSALLLTPTIIDLAKSSSGRVAGPLLSTVPFMPTLLQYFSYGMALCLPRTYVSWLVHRVTGMRKDGAGLKTTVNFLLSPAGVRQALHMAGDELRDMKANKWADEIWGSSSSTVVQSGGGGTKPLIGKSSDGTIDNRWRAPKLFFLFAEKDHWVADVTRDHIVDKINTGSQKKDAQGLEGFDNSDSGSNFGSPVVVIDREKGLVHAWCLEQSEFVAAISKQWIDQSLQSEY